LTTTGRRPIPDDFTPTFVNGDTNNNGQLLDPGEMWLYTGCWHGGGRPVRQRGHGDGHRSARSNAQRRRTPVITLASIPRSTSRRLTNGQDADTPTGPLVAVGSTVTWTYEVTNPGNVPLSNVVLRDDNGTPGDPSDDFTPTFLDGDTNNNGCLDPGETWRYTGDRHGVVQGQYRNVATATGTDPIGQTPTDDGPQSLFGRRLGDPRREG
jgi:hypothetical protein